MKLNLPNKLTFARMIIAIIFMVFLLSPGVFSRCIALILFITAMITDLYDGKIARQRQMVTNLGKLLDPLADKILVTVAFVSFVELQVVSAWMFVLIITREFCVTGLRLIALSKGKLISASRVGKHKTVSQMVVIVLILLLLILRDILLSHIVDTKALDLFLYWFSYIIFIAMSITVGLTLLSGYVYVEKNLSLFED